MEQTKKSNQQILKQIVQALNLLIDGLWKLNNQSYNPFISELDFLKTKILKQIGEKNE